MKKRPRPRLSPVATKPTSPQASFDTEARVLRGGLALLGCLALLWVFAPGLEGARLHWDDDRYLDPQANLALQAGWTGLWEAWFRSFDAAWYPLLQTYLWGMARLAEQSGFSLVKLVKLGNLLLACASFFLLFWTLSALSRGSRLLMGLALLLLLGAWLHPLRIETIVWASNARDSLSVFFLLLSLSLYLRAKPSSFGWLLFALLAALSKTAVALVPLAFPFVRLCLHSPPALGPASEPAPAEPSRAKQSRREQRWRAEILWAVLATGLLLITALLYQGHPSQAERCFLAEGWAEHLSRVSCLQGRLFLRLFSLSPPLPIPAFPEACFSPWVGGLSLAAFLGLGLWAWKTKASYQGPLRLFVVWSAFALLPVAGVIPIHFPLADRYTFLPMIGLAVALFGLGLSLRTLRMQRLLQGFLWLGGLGLGFMALQTREGTALWKESIPLWTANQAKAPKEWAVWVNLAGALGAESRFFEARRALEEAWSLAPERWVVQKGLFFARALEELQPTVAVRVVGIFQASSTSIPRLQRLERFPLLEQHPSLQAIVRHRRMLLEASRSSLQMCSEERQRREKRKASRR